MAPNKKSLPTLVDVDLDYITSIKQKSRSPFQVKVVYEIGKSRKRLLRHYNELNRRELSWNKWNRTTMGVARRRPGTDRRKRRMRPATLT